MARGVRREGCREWRRDELVEFVASGSQPDSAKICGGIGLLPVKERRGKQEFALALRADLARILAALARTGALNPRGSCVKVAGSDA